MSNPTISVTFLCPQCEAPFRESLDAAKEWTCPQCEHTLTLTPQYTSKEERLTLSSCAVCQNEEIYKKKGFPHALGMAILLIACAGFLYFHGQYEPELAWGILLVSAAIDTLLYLFVADVVVCYRCNAHHRGLGRTGNDPFELTIFERYRQEKARQEQMDDQANQS